MNSPARRDLFARAQGYRSALRDPALQHRAEQLGNRDPSQLLRNGLAVVAFALLEDFIRRRTRELVSLLPGSRSFSDLSDQLKTASRQGALRAGLFHARRIAEQGNDPQAFLVSVAEDVASTPSSEPTLSPWSLGFSGSNLGPDELLAILKALRITGSWDCLNRLAQRAGSGGLSVEESFRTLTKRRHHAAHEGSASVPLSDLEGAPDQVLATALSFDAVCSTAVERFLSGSSTPTSHSDVDMIFLRVSGGTRLMEDEQGNVLGRGPRGRKARRLLDERSGGPTLAVVLDRRRVPIEWLPG